MVLSPLTRTLTPLGVSRKAAGALILDQFTDVNNTLLSSHAIAPTNTPSTAWVNGQGTWRVVSNTARKTASGGDGQNVAYCDAGVANVSIQTTFAPTQTYDGGILFNYTDNNNYWIYVCSYNGGSVLRIIYERAAGSFIARAQKSAQVQPFNATYTLKVECNGDSVIAYLDGVSDLSYSVSNRPQKSSTKHGLRSFGATGSDQTPFDNFTVSSL